MQHAPPLLQSLHHASEHAQEALSVFHDIVILFFIFLVLKLFFLFVIKAGRSRKRSVVVPFGSHLGGICFHLLLVLFVLLGLLFRGSLLRGSFVLRGCKLHGLFDCRLVPGFRRGFRSCSLGFLLLLSGLLCSFGGFGVGLGLLSFGRSLGLGFCECLLGGFGGGGILGSGELGHSFCTANLFGTLDGVQPCLLLLDGPRGKPCFFLTAFKFGRPRFFEVLEFEQVDVPLPGNVATVLRLHPQRRRLCDQELLPVVLHLPPRLDLDDGDFGDGHPVPDDSAQDDGLNLFNRELQLFCTGFFENNLDVLSHECFRVAHLPVDAGWLVLLEDGGAQVLRLHRFIHAVGKHTEPEQEVGKLTPDWVACTPNLDGFHHTGVPELVQDDWDFKFTRHLLHVWLDASDKVRVGGPKHLHQRGQRVLELHAERLLLLGRGSAARFAGVGLATFVFKQVEDKVGLRSVQHL